MLQAVRAVELRPPGNTWPTDFDEVAWKLAGVLGTRGSARRLVALVFERSVTIFVPDLEPVSYRPPAHFDTRSRAALTQFYGPKRDLSVFGIGCEDPAVWGKRQQLHAFPIARQRVPQSRRRHIPDPNRAVGGAGCEQPPIPRKRAICIRVVKHQTQEATKADSLSAYLFP